MEKSTPKPENIMIPKQYANIMDALDKSRQTAHTYYQYSIYPDLIPSKPLAEPSYDFWKMTDLFTTVPTIDSTPYESFITLYNIIHEYTPTKIKEKNPTRMSQMVAHHFRILSEEPFDAELTRFASWAMFKEIGKNKPTIFHQEYFLNANPNATIIDLYKTTNQTARIHLRDEVKKYHKQLDGIMNRLHAQSNHYANLKHDMKNWLFGTNTEDIRANYNLPTNKPLTDFMNAYLLATYGNALKNIVHAWDNTTLPREYGTLRDIIYTEMITARKSMEKTFGHPAANFVRNEYKQPISVDDVIKWRNKRELDFAQKHMHDHVR